MKRRHFINAGIKASTIIPAVGASMVIPGNANAEDKEASAGNSMERPTPEQGNIVIEK